MGNRNPGEKMIADLLRNPLTRGRYENDRARVVSHFTALSDSPQTDYLVLRRYLDVRPEKFYDKNSYDTYLRWLWERDSAMPEQLRVHLTESDAAIGRALLSLREINSEGWHDAALTDGGGYELNRMIDRHVHPAYLRLIEAVLTPLLRPIACFSRISRRKGTEGLDAWQIVNELKGQREECLTKQYSNTVRNGIAHGGVTFLQDGIRYRDQRGNEETLDQRSMVRLFDDLVDTCNGLAAAIKVFFLVSRGRGYALPRELLVEALQEQTAAPWWTIDGCVEGEVLGRSQLTVYARPESRDYQKVLWSTFQSGILVESLVSGYDRYFFSLRSQKALPGWAAFDGRKLRALREAGITNLSRYKGVLEDDLLFYVPQPRLPKILTKLDTLVTSIRIALPAMVQEIRDRLGKPRFSCRNASVHRNSWRAVLRSDVVIDGVADEQIVDGIRKNRRLIVRLAKRQARKQCEKGISSILPVGFARVAVFRRDYRLRRLSSFGLADDLVCTVTLKKISRIKSPDLLGSTVETNGNWRIDWNRAWLEGSSQTLREQVGSNAGKAALPQIGRYRKDRFT